MSDEVDLLIDDMLASGDLDGGQDVTATPGGPAAPPPAPSIQGNSRKRPAPVSATSNKKSKQDQPIRWSTELIEELLRSKEEHRAFILEAKNKAKLQQGWSKVLLDLKSRCGITASVTQIKNKCQNLQTKYRQLWQEQSSTGNNPAAPKPPCWAAMVSHFGGSEGMAHSCLNTQTSDAANPGIPSEVGSADSDTDDQSQRPVRARSRRNTGTPDRNTALALLGSEIKEGLQSLGASLSGGSSSSNPKIEKLLNINTELLQENRNQTEQLLKLSSATVELLSKLVDRQ